MKYDLWEINARYDELYDEPYRLDVDQETALLETETEDMDELIAKHGIAARSWVAAVPSGTPRARVREAFASWVEYWQKHENEIGE